MSRSRTLRKKSKRRKRKSRSGRRVSRGSFGEKKDGWVDYVTLPKGELTNKNIQRNIKRYKHHEGEKERRHRSSSLEMISTNPEEYDVKRVLVATHPTYNPDTLVRVFVLKSDGTRRTIFTGAVSDTMRDELQDKLSGNYPVIDFHEDDRTHVLQAFGMNESNKDFTFLPHTKQEDGYLPLPNFDLFVVLDSLGVKFYKTSEEFEAHMILNENEDAFKEKHANVMSYLM